MIKISNTSIKEIGYDLIDEAKIASVFGIGNGYFGIRASLEEFGDMLIQGTYIRGVFDQNIEIPLAICDNTYMKNYYFNGQKLKEFEQIDTCINVIDPLTIRFYVGSNMFVPWKGIVKKWERYIDYKTGGLVRKVIWDDGEGNLTEFNFVRYASFANNHLILQEASYKKINHDLPIKVLSGVDTLVKTNGQRKSVIERKEFLDDGIKLVLFEGNKYSMRVALQERDIAPTKALSAVDEDGVLGHTYLSKRKEATFRKVISMYASIDPVKDYKKATVDALIDFDEALNKHLRVYSDAFKKVDIKIKGDDKVNILVRYANYQSLIGFDRYDSVHSLSAKNLTAEKYNQFVWWDAEIFQMPFVIANFPNAAKSCLEYRYRCLDKAKENARKDGYRGAKFAFCSSIKGHENVWMYVRHPFLQIHINGDICYGVINYYRQTLDKEFMLSKGLEMIKESLIYFISRSTKKGKQYHLLNVTGTDEHHPYVNNDAYTNYQAKFIANEFVRLVKLLKYEINDKNFAEIKDFAKNIFIPQSNDKGIIPQFDNYFSLKPYLPITGTGSGKSFQMKASGLYHLSQIIKQPDVLNLYTYLDIDMDRSLYKSNWNFYYKKCEASSSLTYPVHTISALDFHQNDIFRENLLKSLEIDIEDIHNCAYQGVHAGCLTGGWFAFYRGIFGLRPREDALYIDPCFSMPFDEVSMHIIYQGVNLELKLNHSSLIINKIDDLEVSIVYNEKVINMTGKTLKLKKGK